MYDVQNHRDDRQIPIDKVGVCDLQYPIVEQYGTLNQGAPEG